MTNNNSLVGKYFHILREENKINMQGRVLEKVDEGIFLVVHYSWADGSENGEYLYALEDMLDWIFYSRDEDMREAYARKIK